MAAVNEFRQSTKDMSVPVLRSDDDFEMESKYNVNRFLAMFFGSYLGFCKMLFFGVVFFLYNWDILETLEMKNKDYIN